MVHDAQFISEGKSMAIVRVPGHDHAAIGYALDAGASIVVPQVDTVEQAQHVVSAAKYGAKIKGERSAPPARFMPGISDTCLDPSMTIQENVNRQAAVIIQIESLRGIHNLDAILTECGEHIDSVWLGSLDARVSMGLPGMAGMEPEWLGAVALYESTLKKHNKPASGLALGPPEMKATMAKGKSFLVTGSDCFALLGQMGELAHMRDNFKAMDYSKVYKAI
jgi:4-hydroxy-2-oxoheptanedioate aldolase